MRKFCLLVLLVCSVSAVAHKKCELYREHSLLDRCWYPGKVEAESIDFVPAANFGNHGKYRGTVMVDALERRRIRLYHRNGKLFRSYPESQWQRDGQFVFEVSAEHGDMRTLFAVMQSWREKISTKVCCEKESCLPGFDHPHVTLSFVN